MSILGWISSLLEQYRPNANSYLKRSNFNFRFQFILLLQLHGNSFQWNFWISPKLIFSPQFPDKVTTVKGIPKRIEIVINVLNSVAPVCMQNFQRINLKLIHYMLFYYADKDIISASQHSILGYKTKQWKVLEVEVIQSAKQIFSAKETWCKEFPGNFWDDCKGAPRVVEDQDNYNASDFSGIGDVGDAFRWHYHEHWCRRDENQINFSNPIGMLTKYHFSE